MLSRFQAFFSRVVEQVETRPVPFRQYYYLFFAILAVRLALEFFSSHRLFALDDILHISLWFTFIVLVFMLLLQLFSGEKMERVAKLVITFFSIALTAPIIDLVISGGSGLKMNYLSLNFSPTAHFAKQVLWSYITIGGSSMVRGATPGIRIEIVLLVLAAFHYVRTKRKSLLMGLIAAVVIYTALFLSGTIPVLLSLLVNSFHLQYQEGDQSTLLLLLSANALLLFFCFWRHSPSRMAWLLAEMRWAQILLWGISLTIGGLLARNMYPDNWALSPTTVFQFLLLPAIVICLGVVASSKGGSQRMANVCLLLAALLAVFISHRTFFAVAVMGALTFLLYQEPLLLVRVPFLRNLMQGLLMLSAALFGFSAFGAPMVGFPPQWILLMTWPAAVMAFCLDFAADRLSGESWLHNSSRFVKLMMRILILINLWGLLYYLFWLPGFPPFGLLLASLAIGFQSILILLRKPSSFLLSTAQFVFSLALVSGL